MEEVASIASGTIRGAEKVGTSLIDASRATVRATITGISEIDADFLQLLPRRKRCGSRNF